MGSEALGKFYYSPSKKGTCFHGTAAPTRSAHTEKVDATKKEEKDRKREIKDTGKPV